MGTVYEDEDQVSAVLHAFSEYFEVNNKLMAVKDFVLCHPVVTLLSVVLVLMCSVPIICFMTFVFGSAFLAVTGFVLIEGTVLTIAIILLGGSLLIVGFFAVGFSAIVVAGFFAFDFSFNLIKDLADKLNMKCKTEIKQ